MSLVVFVNPRSRANRRDPGRADRFAGLVRGVGRVIAPTSLEAMDAEARALAAAPPSVIGIHGGDGTLHRSLTALLQAWGDRALPPVLLLAGGTMNVVAASLGIRARPESLLAQVANDLREGRPLQTVGRRCLRVVSGGGADGDGEGDARSTDAYGFVFGNGLMANFLEEYYADEAYGAQRAVWMLGRTFFSALTHGVYARKIFRKFTGTVTADGTPLPWRALTGVGAATVREVGLGFKLNHRADEDPDRFSALAIHGDAFKLVQDLWAVHSGEGVSERRAWSGIAQHLVLEADGGAGFRYTIDGDLYETPPGGGGRLEVRIGPALAFVRPR